MAFTAALRRMEREKTEERQQLRRAQYLLKTHGVAEQDYVEILALQKGVCAICARKPRKKKLAFDHCHTTGYIRGLLCSRCNLGIGSFGDDRALLWEAAAYLQRGGAVHWLFGQGHWRLRKRK